MNDRQLLERMIIASLTDENCPSSEQLADYILGTLTGNDQLRVARHVRECPLCQHLAITYQPAEPRPQRSFIARLLPLAPSAGRRGAVDATAMRRYQVADINILVELLISPPDQEHWSVTGRVMRGGVAAVAAPVTMRADTYRSQQTTDAEGFFAFDQLPPGHYTLEILQPPARVEIPDLILLEDDR